MTKQSPSPGTNLTSQQQQQLKTAHDRVCACAKRAIAPYSKLHVGAVFKVKDKEEWIEGHNIENSSFGATMCAERVGLYNFLSRPDRDQLQLEYLLITAPTGAQGELIPPCALCLQVLVNFLPDDFPIYLSDAKTIGKKYLLGELLPVSFRGF